MGLYRSPQGDLVEVADSEAPHAASVGYTPVGQDEASAALTAPEKFGTGIGGTIGAATTGALSGLTLGASDLLAKAVLPEGDMQSLAEMREAHPYASAGGQIVGAIAPAILSGGASADASAGQLASLFKLTPAAMTSRLGARIAEGLPGVLGGVEAGAFEGAAQNAGAYVSDVALGDRDLSAEGFLGAMGKGALYGGVAAGALTLGSRGLMSARKLIPAADATPAAAALAKSEATRAIRDSVDTSAGLETTGRNAVMQADRETQQFIQDLEAERNAAIKGVADAGRSLPEGSPELATAEGRAPSLETPSKSAPEMLKEWRSRYPDGAVDYDAASTATRRQRLGTWAEGFEATTPEDAAIKDYFSNPQNPIGMGRIGGTADVPDAVQGIARRGAADAAHGAYLDTAAQATNVSQSGTELMARATYAGRQAAARSLDDTYGAYRAGASISDIRTAAGQKLSAQLHELAEARTDMIQSLASDPGAATDLMAQLTGTKAAIDQGVPLAKQSLGQRILAGVEKPVDPDEVIAKAFAQTKDANVDIVTVAPKITRYEAAKANLTESLGDRASPDAIAHAQAFRQAQQEAQATSTRSAVQTAEDIDKAARGVPTENLPGGKSMIKGLAKKASNLGTAYELLRSLGVPLPDPHDVPLIGPLLSLYLKAKIVGKLAGKWGGSFVATAEGTIAAKAAETQNRINGAIDTAFKGASRTMAKASENAGASVFAMKLFDAPAARTPYTSNPKGGKPEDEYRSRLAELTAAMQPGAVAEAVQARITTSDPTIVDAIVAAEQRKLGYLYNAAPKPSSLPLPEDPPFSPSRAELSNFGTVLAAYHDPAAIFERVADGGVARPAEIDCVQNCYPQLYVAAQKRGVNALLKGRRSMSYSRRIAVSSLLGMPIDSTMEPSHAAYLQAANAAAGATAPTPHPMLSGSINLGQQTLTRLDRE